MPPRLPGSTDRRPAPLAIALEQIGWSAGAIQGLVDRIGPVGEAFPEEEPGTWTIEHVATPPRFRGQGLARGLLERAVARGFEQGFRRAFVDVFTGNHKARALYEAAGFRQVATFGHEPLRRILDRDALIRLLRPLLVGRTEVRRQAEARPTVG